MALSSGTKFGPYEIVAPLGAGGMGEVYRARDSRLKREVALKVLPERLARDAMALERFRREAQLLAGLNHPHIAAVYGFEDGALAMELVGGETLADRLQRGALPAAEALVIARQLAEALEYAHEQGIVHRDLKPANIKLTPDDKVKVLDFGLAKALNPGLSEAELEDAPTLSSPATLAGTILGTAAYMAPEQARGKPVDRRADIWAFGAVWFEMLTGKRLFQGETTSDILAGVLRAEPEWEELPAGLPEEQRRLIRRCLRKDPRQRQQSMGDVRLALEEPIATTTPAAESAPRRPWPWMLATAAAAVVAIGLAIYAWLARAGPPSEASHYRAITSLGGVQMQPAFSPDGSSVAFISDQDGSFNLYFSLVGGGTLLQLTHGPEVKSHPAWSPNGHILAYAQLNAAGLSDVWEIPALGGTPRRLLPDAADPTWSPDGKWLAYTRSSTGELWISTPEGEQARMIAPLVRDRNREPRFSPDGTRIAFIDAASGPYGKLDVVNADGSGLRQLNDLDTIADSPAWSPDGSAIYFAWGKSGAINIWKIPAAGGVAAQVTVGPGDDSELDVSADGRRLVFASFRTDTHIAQLDLAAAPGRPATTMLTTDPARNQLAPQYSPDGKRLVYFTNLKGTELEQIWTSNADGSAAAPLLNDAGLSNIFPRWSFDGGQVYFSTDSSLERQARASRRIAADGGPAQTVLAKQFDINYDVGPGNRMVFINPQGAIVVYDPAARQSRTVRPAASDLRPFRVRWSPDGGRIAFAVAATSDNDANAGLWVMDVNGGAPKQVFRGWVRDFERGPSGSIFVRAGSPDLHDPLWTVTWDGHGLTKLRPTLPMPHDYWLPMGRELFAVAPDGRHIAYAVDDDLQATIGMLTFGQ